MSYPRPSGLTPSSGAAFGVTPSPSFPELELQVLDFWKRDDTFRASVQQREGAPEWVFYDGPPFANGLPHYGHLLTGYAKDIFPRFQTMRGRQVHRRFGWDTHGLPAELEAMKQLGITEKSEIESMGVDAFNASARESVLRYTREWEDYVTRQARWVDFEGGYKTLDLSYMESVIWAFKQLYDKGLAYEGYRVLPYCWRDQTPLSNHELRMDDDVYRTRQDQTVTVAFRLHGPKAQELGLEGADALAWTTTPWTLPTNEALVVGPAISYALVAPGPEGAAVDSAGFLLAEELVAAHAKELGYPDAAAAQEGIARRFSGAQLEGLRYQPLFDYFTDAQVWGTAEAWRVLVDDYVTTGEGTGIVHVAPAYGEDDKRVSDAAGLPTIISVDDAAAFLPVVRDVAGLQVFEANMPLVRLLRERGRLLRLASYEHPYPHCWRCRTPLIYKAVSSWFVRVTEIKDRLVELNQEITWVPENVKDGQFGKWLENARDWSISRNRYWGSPIPVWVSDDPAYPRVDVYGSLDELERDFGVRPTDLHRPYIDSLTRPNPDDPSGASTMRRIPDVLDVWFDSGSMPFAQVHYPFENREWFDSHSPADFIVEYIGQTRGWFYVMHALSGALFDRPAFRSVVSHGIVLGSDGNKMSKSLRNYPDVNEVFDRDGSDAMRWFLMSSPVLRGGNLIVTEEGIREGVRQFLLPLWNTWYFFSLYANADGYEAERSVGSSDPLDRYLLAKTRQLILDVQADLEALDSTTACARLRVFAETLTNWYVRRSRDRFWAGTGASGKAGDPANAAAFDTLYTVLETVTRVAAPLVPLIAEVVWQGLTGGRSVHLQHWPDAEEFPADEQLVARMDLVRSASSAALALRKAQGLRVRLPLARMTVVAPGAEGLREFAAILRDELNVKEVEFVDAAGGEVAESYGIRRRLAVNARVAGPRLGKQVQAVIRAAKEGLWSASEQGVTVDGVPLLPEEYELALEVDPEVAAAGTAVGLIAGEGFVTLDTRVTAELEAEGVARDVVRVVQEERRRAGLDVADRIELTLCVAPEGLTAVQEFSALIAEETLAVALKALPLEGEEAHTVGEGIGLAVSLTKAGA